MLLKWSILNSKNPAFNKYGYLYEGLGSFEFEHYISVSLCCTEITTKDIAYISNRMPTWCMKSSTNDEREADNYEKSLKMKFLF